MKTEKNALALLMALVMVFGLVPSISSAVERPDFEPMTQSHCENFSTNYTLTGNGASDMVAIALAQEGKTGSNLGYTEQWCADFIGDCAVLAGQSAAIPANGYVPSLKNQVLNAGGTYSTSNPQPGDLCFIDWSPNDGTTSYDHVELVYAVSGTTVYTIGGNTGGGSDLYTRKVAKHAPLGSSYVICTVRPNYSVNQVPEMPTVTTDRSQYYVGNSVTISWNAVANNTFYWINIYKNGSIIFDANMGNNTSYTLTNIEVGSYTVLLSANNNIGTSGGSSCYFSVVDAVPNAPTISQSATYVETGETLTISWNAVNTATSYTYYVSEYPEAFAYQSSALVDTIIGTSVSFVNLPNGRYRMFVHANNAAGSSAQSNWITFYFYNFDYLPTKSGMYNGHIYAVYDADMAWDFANILCQKAGGNLVTITSAEENSFVCDLISHGSLDAYWIGAHNDSSGSWYNSDNPYEWVTGEEFSYSNWNDGEPNGMGSDASAEHFAEIRKSYGYKWNDTPNARALDKGFVLEIDATLLSPLSTMTFGNSKYLLFDAGISWQEAHVYCANNGGHLATISSRQEDEAITELLHQGSKPWYYLGGYNSGSDWVWVDGTSVPYSGSYANWSDITGTIISGPTGWGNYLMKYRSTGTWLGLQNFYQPLSNMNNMGFVMEIDNAVNALHFNANEGTVSPSSKSIVYGEQYGDLPIPVRQNYTFDGWFTSAQGGTQITASSVVTVKNDQTVYAHWTASQSGTQIGDANLDGTLSFADVAELYNLIFAGSGLTSDQTQVCDVNGDGTISFADVAALYNTVLGSAA